MTGGGTGGIVTLAEIEAARQTLAGVVRVTPLEHSRLLTAALGGPAFLKCENLQRSGSFKVRGAYTRIAGLTAEERSRGVVAASAGNHAQGVALAAEALGAKATVFMPVGAALPKIAATRGYGAEVRLEGESVDDSLVHAKEFADRTSAIFIHPFDHPDVIAGQGTVGLEMMEQAAAIGATPDLVLVGASGGGLISGVAIAVKEKSPTTQIWTVEPAGFDDLARSLRNGQRERNAALSGSICDALLAATPGEMTFEVARRHLAGGLAVSDAEAKAAVRFAFRELKLVLEPGGAVSLAAILAGKIALNGRTVAAVLSGGNIDPSLFADIIQDQPRAA
jgi:threonine dehydratase